jgi:outer membrane protein
MKRLLAFATMATLCGGLNCALLPDAARAHDADAADARDPNDTWFAAFGGGAWAHPRFPGSDSTYAQPLPYFDVRYRSLFLVSGDGLGAYLFRSHGGWAAVSVAPELRQRLQSDDDRLRGLGDVHRTARAEFQAGYAADCFTAKSDVASDIAHRGQGTIVDLSLIAHHVVFGRLQVESGVAAQWANRLFDKSFYGITAGQSTASGLPEYSAGSGLDELRVFFGANFAIDRDWLAVGRVAAVHLGRRAADSPITERRTDAEFQLFAAYRF